MLGQGYRDEAAPLLAADFKGMRRRPDPLTPARRAQLGRELVWLGELAEASGRPEGAEARRRGRDQFEDPPPTPTSPPGG